MLPDHPNLTPGEIQKFLKVSKSTVYAMIAEGEIPHHMVRRQIRIDREEFLSWWKRQKKPSR